MCVLALFAPLGDARTVSVQRKDTQPTNSHVQRPSVAPSGATLQQHIQPKGYCVGCEAGNRNSRHAPAHVNVGQRASGPSRPVPLRASSEGNMPATAQPVGQAKPVIPPKQEAPGTETPFGRAKRAIEPDNMEARDFYHGDDHQWADDDHHHRVHPDTAATGLLVVLLISGGVFFVLIFIFFMALAQKRSRRTVTEARMVDLETRDRFGRTRHIKAIEREIGEV